jgi:tetratricopeptide (TPR) repeat protein
MDDAVRLHDLAVSRWAEGRPQEAVPLCRQALTRVEYAVGRQHPDVANLLNTLAGLYADLGDYDEAERLAQRSVAMMEGVTGDVELEVLRVQSLGTLAGLYRVQGRYAEAEPLYQRALRWGEAALGPRHLEVATCLNNFAVLYKYTAHFGRAARLYRGALAGILDGQGKYDEAEALYRRALAGFERTLGPDHDEVAVSCNNLAALHHARGDCVEAERPYRRALAIKETRFGLDHVDVALTLNNLAVLYKSPGRYGDAEPLYQRALTIFETRLRPRHPKGLTCRRNHAQLLRETQRKIEALAMEARSRRGREPQAPRLRAPCQDRNDQR